MAERLPEPGGDTVNDRDRNGADGRCDARATAPDALAGGQVAPQAAPRAAAWHGVTQAHHHLTHAWQETLDWLRTDTYVPEWLPRPMRRKVTGYLAAILAQVIAAFLTLQLMALLPAFALQSALAYLGVVCAAALFGAGPGVVGTVAATALLEYIVLPPHFTWRMDPAHLVNILLYLLVGITTTVLITRMLQALRIANAATQRMEELLSVTSHELRNPLAAIKAAVQLAERRVGRLADASFSGTGPVPVPDSSGSGTATQKPAPTPEDVLTALVAANRQVAALDALIADLLDTSRIRTGQLHLEPARFDLVALLGEVVEDQRGMHPDREIELRVEPGDGAVMVYADPKRIAQVASNYLTNALKYAPDGEPIVVGLALSGFVARVWVRDHGPGLPVEQHGRVWEMFYRAPGIQAPGESRASLGLGLPISRAIVERHGGEVGLQSAPGRGSTFSFTLPLAR